MHSFLILCSVISAAYAASLGYNYESSSGATLGGSLGGGQVIGSGLSSGGQSNAGPSYSSSGLSLGSGTSGGGISLSSQGGVGSSYFPPSLSFGSGVSGGSVGGFSSGGQGAVGSGGPVSVPAETTKEFFTYTAPEHEFADIGDSSQVSNSLKKYLRVIFIKGPENSGLDNAAVQLAKSVANEQTVIYVLNKQADIGHLAEKLQSVQTQNFNKPEVHFVKYRTAADAEHAQHTIRSQYDGLSGPTNNHNGDVAPVLNFASNPELTSAPQQGFVSTPVVQQSDAAASVGNGEISYLPPNKRA
ncbi:uncharacterized protein [Eurosta solidaginis]|uniref:uncharacterized protein n=1 Tax=Eurosta solidaginis TaxID=178769 RepID=UPI00353173E4